MEGKGHFLFLALLRCFRKLVILWPLDDGTCFCEGFLIEIASLFDSLDFSRVIAEAEFMCGTSRLEKHVLFDNRRPSLRLRFKSFATVLNVFVC